MVNLSKEYIEIKAIKKEAIEKLGGKCFSKTWLTMILPAFVSIISYCYLYFLMGPSNVGLSCVFIRFNKNTTNDFLKNNLVSDFIRSFFARFGRNVIIGLFIYFIRLILSGLLIMPGIIFHYNYYFVYFIAADHPEWTFSKCLDRCAFITKGFKWKLFLLDISFVGWYIIGLLCGVVGIFVVVPYHMMAKTLIYEKLRCDLNGTFFELG